MCSGDDTRPRWCVIYIYNVMLWLIYTCEGGRSVVKIKIKIKSSGISFTIIIIILRLHYVISEKKSQKSLCIRPVMNEFIKRLFRSVASRISSSALMRLCGYNVYFIRIK